MSIEQAIQDLTAAVRECTATQRELLVIASAGAAKNLVPDTPVAETRKKIRKTEAVKPVEVEEEPAAEKPAAEEPATEEPATEEPATEEPATEEPATEEPATEDIEALRVTLRETIKSKLNENSAHRTTFDAMRKNYGVETIKDLKDGEVRPFLTEVEAW